MTFASCLYPRRRADQRPGCADTASRNNCPSWCSEMSRRRRYSTLPVRSASIASRASAGPQVQGPLRDGGFYVGDVVQHRPSQVTIHGKVLPQTRLLEHRGLCQAIRGSRYQRIPKKARLRDLWRDAWRLNGVKAALALAAGQLVRVGAELWGAQLAGGRAGVDDRGAGSGACQHDRAGAGRELCGAAGLAATRYRAAARPECPAGSHSRRKPRRSRAATCRGRCCASAG